MLSSFVQMLSKVDRQIGHLESSKNCRSLRSSSINSQDSYYCNRYTSSLTEMNASLQLFLIWFHIGTVLEKVKRIAPARQRNGGRDLLRNSEYMLHIPS